MAAALFAFAWLLGVGVAAFFDSEIAALVAASSFVAAGTFAYRTRKRSPARNRHLATIAMIALGVGGVFLGGWRYDSAPDPDLSLARFNDGPAVTMRGVIADEPELRETAVLYRFDVREVVEDGTWREQSGKVLLRGPVAPTYEYGDLIEMKVELETPPSFPDFDYRDYLARQGVASLASFPEVVSVEGGHKNWLRAKTIDVRERLSEALSDVLPEPHSSLAAGILYGERSNIPDDLKEDMRVTGTSHLVAVSGQNVTLVAAMVIAVLSWVIGRRPASWVSLGAIVGYTMLVGVQPSVIRAAIMGGVYVIATISGRQRSSVIALMFAAAGMTAVEPTIIDDVSFQLSFAATLGLATFASPLYQHVMAAANRRPALALFPLTRPVVEMFSVTIAAVLFTMPIGTVYFGQISIVAPVANLFAVPAFLLVGASAGAATGIALIDSSLAPVGAWIAWPFAEYMIEVIQLFARVPGASVTIDGVTRWHAVGWYAALLVATWWIARQPIEEVEAPKEVAGTRSIVPMRGVALLIGLAGIFAALWFSRPEGGQLSVTVMDVGQGDAILIEGPRGNRILVDGGPGSLPITRALSRNMPFDSKRIDLVVLTHAQLDHAGGLLTVVEQYDVGEVLDAAVPAESSLYETWKATLRESGVAVTTADRGQSIELGDGAVLQVIGPDADDPLLATRDLNTTSTVLRLTMGEASFLLTGDLDDEGEAALLRSGTDLRATVLKVGHHGSKTSTSPAFLARVQPSIDIVSVGEANRFGHPTTEVLDRLDGDVVLRTDEDGDVTVSTDGERIWVER